jgi:predicted nuclease of predicted toxin-antitoxin system
VIIWVDAQLSPALAPWLSQEFGVEAISARRLGMVKAKDPEIFQAAREAKAVVFTKDADFTFLLERFGAPPQVLWVRCGNTSNAYLRGVLTATLPEALRLLEAGEALVEITDLPL